MAMAKHPSGILASTVEEQPSHSGALATIGPDWSTNLMAVYHAPNAAVKVFWQRPSGG
jgi:hypothetical protein